MNKRLEEIEIDIDDLLNAVNGNVKENCKDFTDLLSFQSSLSREIYLGEIGDGTGTVIDGIIRFWNRYDKEHDIPIEDREPIKIYIDSIGGSLTDTFTIIDSIRMSVTPVWTICTGCAYSGGFFTLIAGHKRFAYPHSSFLFHEGSTSNGGTAGQFENYTAFYKKQLLQLKDIVTTYTNISEDEYLSIKKDDVWYDVNEALEKGIIDEVMERFV